jgi:hypothetical protein
MDKKTLTCIGIIILLFGGIIIISRLNQNKSSIKPSRVKLSQVKIAVVYQSITDYQSIELMTNGKYKRSLEDIINILKETNTDFVFQVFWRWGKVLIH